MKGLFTFSDQGTPWDQEQESVFGDRNTLPSLLLQRFKTWMDELNSPMTGMTRGRLSESSINTETPASAVPFMQYLHFQIIFDFHVNSWMPDRQKSVGFCNKINNNAAGGSADCLQKESKSLWQHETHRSINMWIFASFEKKKAGDNFCFCFHFVILRCFVETRWKTSGLREATWWAAALHARRRLGRYIISFFGINPLWYDCIHLLQQHTGPHK